MGNSEGGRAGATLQYKVQTMVCSIVTRQVSDEAGQRNGEEAERLFSLSVLPLTTGYVINSLFTCSAWQQSEQ